MTEIPTSIQSQIISSIPEHEMTRTPDNGPQFDFDNTQIVTHPDALTAGQKLLNGPRNVGAISLPSGGIEIHEITADGMKQSRRVGPAYKSAADFHVAAGVATPEEIERVKNT